MTAMKESIIADVRWSNDGVEVLGHVVAVDRYGLTMPGCLVTNGGVTILTEFLWQEMRSQGARIIPKHPKVPSDPASAIELYDGLADAFVESFEISEVRKKSCELARSRNRPQTIERLERWEKRVGDRMKAGEL